VKKTHDLSTHFAASTFVVKSVPAESHADLHPFFFNPMKTFEDLKIHILSIERAISVMWQE